jgi:hypothetical protein
LHSSYIATMNGQSGAISYLIRAQGLKIGVTKRECVTLTPRYLMCYGKDYMKTRTSNPQHYES